MTSVLNPYLSFDGDAREAMQAYERIFGGTLQLNTFGESGMQGPDADKIMHATLRTEAGFTLMGSDTPTGMQYTRGSSFAVSVSGDDESQLRGYWEQLADGAEVGVQLEKQMWGDVFGMCTDRFGVPWMIDIHEPVPES